MPSSLERGFIHSLDPSLCLLGSMKCCDSKANKNLQYKDAEGIKPSAFWSVRRKELSAGRNGEHLNSSGSDEICSSPQAGSKGSIHAVLFA